MGKIADLGKSLSDTVKTAKELAKIKELREINKNKKKEYVMTPEMEEKLNNLGRDKSGSGFAAFGKQ